MKRAVPKMYVIPSFSSDLVSLFTDKPLWEEEKLLAVSARLLNGTLDILTRLFSPPCQSHLGWV